ncbi:MAG: hypothetical protein PHH01_00925 [Patescibacteria group bacterium]|nr:hypothetical protein [Patescibacteria group bacterium]MDD5566736.1 hypothetical protein [Patescibacteria group bacterium]
MSTSNHHVEIEKRLAQKAQRRQYKKKPKMKVNSRSILRLQKIIGEKAHREKLS